MGDNAILTLPQQQTRPAARVGKTGYSQPLWLWTLLGLIAFGPLLLLMTNAGDIPGEVRALGGVLWLLSWGPALVYFATPAPRRAPMPALPIMGALFGLYFALQLLLG